jgi:nitroreductase
MPGPFQFLKHLIAILRGRPRVPPGLADNELLRTILRRRSVRSFTRQPVPDEIFAVILEAGRLAPSTVNLQTWSFVTFDAASWLTAFGHSIPFRGDRAVVVLADTHRLRSLGDLLPTSPLVDHTAAVMNASLAAMNMNIAAEALGVASVMLSETGRSGMLDADFLIEKLCLPADVYPLMTIVFGYPAGATPPMPPKLPAEVVCFPTRYREPAPWVMPDWLGQMKAGYKASHLLSSFDAQLRVYAAKLQQAEETLNRLIFK